MSLGGMTFAPNSAGKCCQTQQSRWQSGQPRAPTVLKRLANLAAGDSAPMSSAALQTGKATANVNLGNECGRDCDGNCSRDSASRHCLSATSDAEMARIDRRSGNAIAFALTNTAFEAQQSASDYKAVLYLQEESDQAASGNRPVVSRGQGPLFIVVRFAWEIERGRCVEMECAASRSSRRLRTDVGEWCILHRMADSATGLLR